MRSLCVCIGLCLGGAALAGDGELRATVTEPRAFGYYLGDRILREVTLHVPDGLKLDEDSLPQIGARGQALELQQVALHAMAEDGGTRQELQLRYQVFRSPPETRTLETAPIILRFSGKPRPQELRIEAWPVTVSPLVPVEAPSREGLGELRPDQPPLFLPTKSLAQRLWIESAAAGLVLAYLAQVYLVMPWWTRRHRPFGTAWAQLRKARAGASRASLQRMHEALNEAAGEVLFAQGLDRFLAAQPRYQGLQAEFLEFFRRSRLEFFGEGPGSGEDGQWVIAFSRKCRDAERGAA